MSLRHAGILSFSFAVASLAAWSGCADEKISPLDGGTATTSGGSTTGEMPGPPIREVFERNPWGSPPENLLVDGDYELSISPGTGQYGWVAFDAAQTMQVPIDNETGGACRSGLRCAILTKGQLILGRGTAAADIAGHQASIFAKAKTPPAADADLSKFCAKVATVQMITCDDFVPLATLKAAMAPGDDGYCEYSGTFAGSTQSVCMLVDVKADAIFDNASLVAAPAATSGNVPFSLDLEESTRMKWVADWVRKHRRFGEATSPAVREDLR